ncbi:RNase H family protein [Micromonospora aurantiaca (nom. illeg.)]|uniref:RNase H family protein n=1 Tax=Micromonospora aurantiaca (nom. illeg.) TaxID=47850 RepID=UPI0033D0A340
MSRILTGTVRAPANTRLLVATDGSADGGRRREYRTGFGWLATDGTWGVGWCPQPAQLAGRDVAVVAELRAVYHAVAERLPTGPVTVLVDSRSALDYLTGWAGGDRRMPRGYLGSQKHTPMVTRLAELVAAHPGHLDARWVRGHSGHLLNECADSLARLGRRWLVERLLVDEVRRRADFLAAGFLADRRAGEVLAA